MIVGIGTDVVEIQRIERALEKHGKRFAQRILTEAEFAQFAQRGYTASFLAKRFAAKEAVAKALGSGFQGGLSLKHIEVYNDDRGAPHLSLVGKGEDLAQQLGVSDMHISLSDEREYAQAFVILEK